MEKSLREIDLKKITAGRKYYPSPVNWEDEVLYFLMVDRFSNCKETGGFNDNDGKPIKEQGRSTALFSLADSNNIERNQWFANGKGWCGGNLKGLIDKLGYLKRMGITAVWVSPVFTQVTGSDTYHGYAIQNFLDVDPHYGTRDELRSLVDEAHRLGIHVILDIVLNHAGDVFSYRGGVGHDYVDGVTWDAGGYRKDQKDYIGSIPFHEIDPSTLSTVWPAEAIWPTEFQAASTWSRRGQIRNWDNFPEYLEGDFFGLKDMDHGSCDNDVGEWDLARRISTFSKTKTLKELCELYKFWIAYADIDGYRIDTVKHIEPGAARIFANTIHEFASSIGKENFYLIGEITGGRSRAVDIVDYTGLDAALGIDDIQYKMQSLAKGTLAPYYDNGVDTGYFNLFNNSLIDGKSTHQWFASRVVIMFDDHDKVGVNFKYRYCGQVNGYRSLPLALALNLTTLGIPCIYYGTEQGFNGADQRTNDSSYSDLFLRECMFGNGFGSFQSSSKHFFNEENEMYKLISYLCILRKENAALRRGRQYLRQIANEGQSDFYFPAMVDGQLKWVVAWSRIFDSSEIVCMINTDLDHDISVRVTVDNELNPGGSSMQCIFCSALDEVGMINPVIDIDGRSVLDVTVKAGGILIYKNQYD